MVWLLAPDSNMVLYLDPLGLFARFPTCCFSFLHVPCFGATGDVQLSLSTAGLQRRLNSHACQHQYTGFKCSPRFQTCSMRGCRMHPGIFLLRPGRMACCASVWAGTSRLGVCGHASCSDEIAGCSSAH